MGKPKQKWTQEEEDALIAGIEKHGPGKWMDILLDPQFAPSLVSRSNVDIKDKWRNMNVSSTLRLPRLKASASASSASAQVAATARFSEVAVISDHSQSDQDVKNPPDLRLPRLKAPASATAGSSEVAVSDPSQCDPPGYDAMILEAVSTLKDANGSDLNAIVMLIEEKHKVPESFRREMTTRLRGLVNQGMLEKVRTCYKIKKEASLETKSPSPKQKDVRPQQQSPVSGDMVSNDTMREAEETAAYSVADAENKSYLAAEAVKEMETISLLADENDLMQRLVMDYYRKCLCEAARYPL